MSERLDEALLWHKVVAEPEFDGFRVLFEFDPGNGELDPSVPETLVGIIRDVTGDLA
ncbi:MAG: hypothetical protein IPK93_05240 [Solirubrobacterales bacterium]|nr:hypothetical protein [Solirubrobacterales bacterium]